MDNLSHELIAAIGDFLAPKWRLRLFLCRKEWARECIWPQKWLFQRYANMHMSLNIINNMEYNIVEDSKVSISRRRLQDGNVVYIRRNKCELGKRFVHNAYHIFNKSFTPNEAYWGANHCVPDVVYNSNKSEMLNFIVSYYEKYMSIYKPELYVIYYAVILLSKYLDIADYVNLTIAFNLYFMPYTSMRCKWFMYEYRSYMRRKIL
jgi:hypothetical protein